MIAILVAVKQELRPILRRANAPHVVRQEHLDFYEGTLADQPVALLALGVGKECARIAAEMTVRCYRPDLVVSAGFGGGLQSRVENGDIVIGTAALELTQDTGTDVAWRTVHERGAPLDIDVVPNGYRLHYGRIITSDEMILKSEAKERIGRATDALAVDMETSAVAAVCRAHQTDFLAVRCISDNSHEDLPEEFNDFFVIGQLRPRRIVSACGRHPTLVLDLARLGYRAQTAGLNLARFLESALASLRLPAALAR
jgi:adenosylhomocysteine nucleosidase